MPIRQLKETDKTQVLEIDRTVFGESDGGWTSDDFDHFFRYGSCFIFHEEDKPDEIIGYIFSGQNNHGTYISNIAVKSGYEGRGIGRELMKVVMLKEAERSKDKTFSTALQVRADNERAKNFYERLGYKVTSSNGTWLQMQATALPALFLEAQNPTASLSDKQRQAVIIRNIDALESSDLKVALEGMERNDKAPQEFNELITLVNSPDELNFMQLERALYLFKNERVRNYIYASIREKTGNHVIYHLNGIDDSGRINEKNAHYIIEKLRQIPSDSHFDMLYVGGGHGDPALGSSNLSSRQLQAITHALNENKTHFSSVILGSCFSTAYSALYQPLLDRNGVMISNSLECGGDNNFRQSIEWMNGSRDEFFSQEDIMASERGIREARSGIKRMLEAVIPMEVLRPDADLLFEQYNGIITRMQALKNEISIEQIKILLDDFPTLNKHINTLIDQKVNQQTTRQEAEDVVLSTLKNRVLQPYPTSLAVTADGTLTLINFSQFDEMPPNATFDYVEDYGSVIQTIRQAAAFQVNELTEGFDGVSAKKQFNGYFASATSKTAQAQHTPQEQTQDDLTVPAQDDLTVPNMQANNVQRINPKDEDELKSSQHKNRIKVSMDKINEVLDTLVSRIGQVDQHHFPEAVEKAQKLLLALNTARDKYYEEILKVDCNLEQIGTQFKHSCKAAIDAAKPVLSRDLSWGEYLGNLMLSLANAVISVVSFGQINTFFTPAKSKSETAVEQAETDILNEGKSKLP
ncbi:GNAT family N-acetyltransferase [Legionella bononiensis]|uniref:GNAT family N-acetyltransferase n=1 Tax=Legionella bononiensis TaxID=2793102 RepID=A0ABS1WD67_9GAMM|nr:N-acetyltransferase [Legionella bononiensis]MBL7481205.1 GNAT family N-acetyltransferase [Legionella bononiensis]MBL7527311.1 GNAT family N-acetyltransferase [Legionella bononiensis]MBL7562280.1 GNAT family N-acetyltransferase [Legionella bononiensis]